MVRLSKIVCVVLAVMASASMAAAGEWGCPREGCFPGDYRPAYPAGRVHNFHPRLRDGEPLVNDFLDYPEAYHGVGCVWSRGVVLTPHGPAWGIVPYCLNY